MPKGAAWSSHESLLLAKAFINTTEDRVHGTGQTAGTYHGRMFETFSNFCDDFNDARLITIATNASLPATQQLDVPLACPPRTGQAMITRLREQNAEVQNFENAYNSARHLRSGGDEAMLEEDVTHEWLRLVSRKKYNKKVADHLRSKKPPPPEFTYTRIPNPVFRLRNVWLYLRNKPKFASLIIAASASPPPAPAVGASISPHTAPTRTRGRDSAKHDEKALPVLKTISEQMLIGNQNMARRTDVLERGLDLAYAMSGLATPEWLQEFKENHARPAPSGHASSRYHRESVSMDAESRFSEVEEGNREELSQPELAVTPAPLTQRQPLPRTSSSAVALTPTQHSVHEELIVATPPNRPQERAANPRPKKKARTKNVVRPDGYDGNSSTLPELRESPPPLSDFHCDYDFCKFDSHADTHICQYGPCVKKLHHICIDAAGVPCMEYFCSIQCASLTETSSIYITVNRALKGGHGKAPAVLVPDTQTRPKSRTGGWSGRVDTSSEDEDQVAVEGDMDTYQESSDEELTQRECIVALTEKNGEET
jgi:hypothetical protein